MTIRIKMHDNTAELYLYDVIGEDWFGGVTAKQFAEQLKALKDADHIDVRINSVGGDVFEGMAMHQLLTEQRDRVTVRVDALAASIASVIAMSAPRRVMAKNAYLMVHNPYTLAMGDAAELKRVAGVLDMTKETIVGVYHEATGIERETLATMMDEETWLPAAEAHEAGWATEISAAEPVAASLDTPVAWKRCPIKAKAPPITPRVKDRRGEIERWLKMQGWV